MPHVSVKLWPGKSEEQKQRLADKIAQDIIDILGSSDASISVAIEDIDSEIWPDAVYEPDIVQKTDKLYKKPGYGSLAESK
ncbi:MAG: tautomerase family protein [Cyanobacteria bacterium REEB67]|nr:tautomerase family protein [Cyanobacteria bacterium REEB67]